MRNQYRVKAFIFVNADSKKEAEEIAGGEIGASTYRDKGKLIEQKIIRENGAKRVILKPKNQ